MNGLDWQVMDLPLAAGLDQKADTRAQQPPALAIFRNGQFDEIGGIQTRKPFAVLSMAIFGGGTVEDIRRIVEHNNELLLFTKDTLYSWNAQLTVWVSKGTHLAVKLAEHNVFVSGNEQVQNDRAELDGTVVYTWAEQVGATYRGYVAAVDKTTGNVLMAPTALAGSAYRLRVLALETVILLSFYDGIGGLYGYALDPASPATALGGSSTTLTNSSFGEYYDIAKVPDADQAVFACRRSPTTSYLVGTVTAGLTVATSTKARTCDGPIAVSCEPNGTHVQIARSDTSTVKGDYIEIAGFVDVFTAQAIGDEAPLQIAAAHRSVEDSGEYRCYVFWGDDNTGDGNVYSNWVDTGGNLGTDAQLVARVDVGSRAFDHDGRVYLWLVFASPAGSYGHGGQLQNASFLYRDDGFLVAKSTWNRGGGFLTTGHLPGVASVGVTEYEYAYCATERAFFGELASGNYSGKRPRDVVVTFDTNEARRTASIGRTLYISGGEILQYDGQRLTELGFHVWPWYFVISQQSGGSVADGTYGWKLSYRSDNAQAERDRSAAPLIETFAVTGGPRRMDIQDAVPLFITHKPAVAVEVWRSQVNPTDDAPYYLATSPNPSMQTNPNRYLPSDTTVPLLSDMQDALADASLVDFGANPQDVTLPSLAPPAATIVHANDSRLFLAGVAGDPHNVWYSKQRVDGEVVAFFGGLVAAVPPDGGSITSLAHLNETLVVFRETSIYMLPGDGVDNAGGGQNYGPARTLSSDIGAVNHESVAVTDKGIIFKSSKGWYLLTRGWSLEYIGGPIADFDSWTVLSVDVVESQHQVRILVQTFGLDPGGDVEGDVEVIPSYYSRMLVLDTLVGQWGEWTVSDGVHSCMWNGSHMYVSESEAKKQRTDYTGVDYGIDLETAWIKLGSLQGFGRIRAIQILGEYCSTHQLRMRLARDYWRDGVDTYFQDKSWTPSPTEAGGRLKLKHGPSIQQVEALKIRLTVEGVSVTTPATYAADSDLADGQLISASALVPGTAANGWTVTVDGGGTAFDANGTWVDGTDAFYHADPFGSSTVALMATAAEDSAFFAVAGAGFITTLPVVLTMAGGAEESTEQGDPTGESLKLTGISLELGFKRALNRQLPAAQKQ